MNENYSHPEMPKNVEQGIIDGIYLINKAKNPKVQLMGSGVILREVEQAAKLLKDDFNIESNTYSVTSFTELRRNAMEIDRWNMLNPEKSQKNSVIQNVISDKESPIVASTDYMKSYAEQIASFIPNKFKALGTDGYGRSDSREALRNFFEVDRYFIVVAALNSLADLGKINKKLVSDAINKYNININKNNPVDS